jgi:hypothetical protein
MLATVSPLWGIAAASITAAAGIAGQAGVRLRESRDRRRDEYGRAFAAAMTWLEFPYRIARRVSDDDEVLGALVEAMHESQEEIYYHQGWLRTASPEIAARYQELVTRIKSGAEPHFAAAWGLTGNPSALLAGRFTVDTDAAVASFVAAVRRDLSYRQQLFGRDGAAPPLSDGYRVRLRQLALTNIGSAAVIALLVAAADALIKGDWHVPVIFGLIIAAAPTAWWVWRYRQRGSWLLLTAVEMVLLSTLTVFYGLVAGALAIAAFALALFARDLLLGDDRDQ